MIAHDSFFVQKHNSYNQNGIVVIPKMHSSDLDNGLWPF
jgi:hypothetical protein